MRFSVSAALDTVETRLTLDPALVMAVVDVADVVRATDLDGHVSRPASLLRLGHVIDHLAARLGEGGVVVHPVVDRALLTDPDLPSNERMAVRRWADDGRVEVLDDPADRVLQLAELLGVPVVTGRDYTRLADRYPWLPAGVLTPVAGGLAPRGAPVPPRTAGRLLERLWRCQRPDCPTFGTPYPAQPPPRLAAGVPSCPRHGTRLAAAGVRPPARVMAVRMEGAVRGRFAVREGEPTVVGRSPEVGPPATGVALASWLGAEAMRWVSRSHLRLELHGGAVVVVDTSTNGTVVRTPTGAVVLTAGQPYRLGADDVVELYRGVELAAPGRLRDAAAAGSVMAEAPTVALRRPGDG